MLGSTPCLVKGFRSIGDVLDFRKDMLSCKQLACVVVTSPSVVKTLAIIMPK